MPELCEVLWTAQYLKSKVLGRYMTSIKVLSGRYTHENMIGQDLVRNRYKITGINTRGKFMWFELVRDNDDSDTIYIMNTYGLTGEWGFVKQDSSRVCFTIENTDGTKQYKLYYTDPRNFGTIIITNNREILDNKINRLAPDLLQTSYDFNEFKQWISTIKKQDQNIVKVLMSQDVGEAIGSGLGNYMTAEILYRAKISPHRQLDTLTPTELKRLYNTIKYTTKLCYYNNKTSYITHLDEYMKRHRDNKHNDYHPDVIIDNDDTFDFMVYQRDTDDKGNKVVRDEIIKGRTTWWVPNIQK